MADRLTVTPNVTLNVTPKRHGARDGNRDASVTLAGARRIARVGQPHPLRPNPPSLSPDRGLTSARTGAR